MTDQERLEKIAFTLDQVGLDPDIDPAVRGMVALNTIMSVATRVDALRSSRTHAIQRRAQTRRRRRRTASSAPIPFDELPDEEQQLIDRSCAVLLEVLEQNQRGDAPFVQVIEQMLWGMFEEYHNPAISRLALDLSRTNPTMISYGRHIIPTMGEMERAAYAASLIAVAKATKYNWEKESVIGIMGHITDSSEVYRYLKRALEATKNDSIQRVLAWAVYRHERAQKEAKKQAESAT